jgi:HNH endonuclease
MEVLEQNMPVRFKFLGETNFMVSTRGEAFRIDHIVKDNGDEEYRRVRLELRSYTNNNGYLYVVRGRKPKRNEFKCPIKILHRSVLESFVPNPENKKEVNHINGNKHDNRLENLEWATRSENMLHSVRVLGNPAGSKNFGKIGNSPEARAKAQISRRKFYSDPLNREKELAVIKKIALKKAKKIIYVEGNIIIGIYSGFREVAATFKISTSTVYRGLSDIKTPFTNQFDFRPYEEGQKVGDRVSEKQIIVRTTGEAYSENYKNLPEERKIDRFKNVRKVMKSQEMRDSRKKTSVKMVYEIENNIIVKIWASMKDIAKEFSISPSYVSSCVNDYRYYEIKPNTIWKKADKNSMLKIGDLYV